jgi:speckle-type POZ protein
MFEHQMIEGKSNRVKIDDVDPDVMTEVLRFIYTGRINNIEKMSDLLLPVADKVICLIFIIKLKYILTYIYN